MRNHKIFHHTIYYFVELAILFFGFAALMVFSSNFSAQLLIMGGILTTYLAMGLIHHKIHHDLHAKIVIEYVLISMLVGTAFLFLNASKL